MREAADAKPVTRDYLDARLAATRDQLTWRVLGGTAALLALYRLSDCLVS